MGNKKELIVLSDVTPDIISEWKVEQFNAFLNQHPHKAWIKRHPYIKNYQYIPIDKIEYMLRKCFKRYKIEITGQGTAFNGVWVTVRIHFLHPIFNEWDFHDGIGGEQLQLRSQTDEEKADGVRVAFDPTNINNGALSMAFPIAKTKAVKDATDHFGKMFGSDLNRKDTIPFDPDEKLKTKAEQRIDKMIDSATSVDDLQRILDSATIPEQYVDKFEQKMKELK